MIALVTLLSVVGVSIVVIRVATKALQLTGLAFDAARFQAYSAFTGTGFTTDEAESIVEHPVRRRIIVVLMALKNAGLVTAISTVVLSFVQTASSGDALRRGGVLFGGLIVLALLARSRWVDRYLSRLIEWALNRYTDLGVRDYYRLLNLSGDYTVARFRVGEGTWLAERKINELDLPEEGVLILGIIREDGSWVGAPRGRYEIHTGDTLVVYGKSGKLAELDERLAGSVGDGAHERARHEHAAELREQDVEEGDRRTGKVLSL